MNLLLPCLYSFIACIGFCLVFNIRSPLRMITASLVGALGWGVYLLCGGLHNDFFQYFIATIVISICSEILARIFKAPVTEFLVVSLLPMVPGGGIYYTMEYCINGETSLFLETGLHTLGIAGSLAVGILLVSSVVRQWHTVHHTLDRQT